MGPAEEKWEPLVVMRSLYVARSPVRLLSLGRLWGLFVSLGPMLLCRVASIHCPPSSPSWWTTPHVDYRFWGSVDCKLLLTICYATGGGALSAVASLGCHSYLLDLVVPSWDEVDELGNDECNLQYGKVGVIW